MMYALVNANAKNLIKMHLKPMRETAVLSNSTSKLSNYHKKGDLRMGPFRMVLTIQLPHGRLHICFNMAVLVFKVHSLCTLHYHREPIVLKGSHMIPLLMTVAHNVQGIEPLLYRIISNDLHNRDHDVRICPWPCTLYDSF